MNTKTTKTILTAATAVTALGFLGACGTAEADSAPAGSSDSPSDILADDAWETTGAVDENGKKVKLDNPDVVDFVGYAYYEDEGTFTMYTLDDKPKLQGDWTVTEDGSERTIVGKDAEGNELFTRTSEIVTLDEDEFTYRVYLDENDKSDYVDIVHTPTDHDEPESPSEVLADDAWETTGAVDQDGKKVKLDDERAANYVGYAYFDEDGTFNMYNLDDSPKLQGDWTVTPNGDSRTIVAKDENGEELFTRTTPIVTLNEDEFTYRVVDENDESKYVDIIHTPTDHDEPEND